MLSLQRTEMKINLRFRRIADYLKLHRKEAALAFAVGCIALLSWALVRSYKEPTELAAAYPYPPLPEEFVHFRLTVLGIDEVNRIAEVKAEVISNWNATDNYIRLLRLRGVPPIVVMRMSGPDVNSKAPFFSVVTTMTLSTFLHLPRSAVKERQPSPGEFLMNPSKATLYFGPLTLRDVARSFDSLGLAALVENPTPAVIDATPGPTYKTEPPPSLSAEVEMVGEAWRYPFDHYVLIGEILCNVLITIDTNSKDFRSFDVQQTDVDVRSPGFVQKSLSFDDLKRLRGEPRVGILIIKHPKTGQVENNKDAVFNIATQAREKSFAIEIRRPFFLRFFSVFLLVVTVASMAYYIVKSTVREFGLQAMAYFAGLWAVRQILMSNGPKSFTLVDYTVLTLYFGLIVALLAKAIYTPKAIPH